MIHDWSRVIDGVFHDFHTAWIVAIRSALNDGLLPPGYYALAEQVVGDIMPDGLTLEATLPAALSGRPSLGTITPAQPKTWYTATAEIDRYAAKQRRVAIRHASGDRVVALIEVVSRGNKSSRHALDAFVAKAADALTSGLHLLLLDLQPLGPRDPHGIHGALWREIGPGLEPYIAPAGKPLTLASYAVGCTVTAFVEPVAVGDTLPDMPLFLEPAQWVPVPLEATYIAAYGGLPARWRRVLEEAQTA
jgi:Protein of unknown function (DUF4058)